MNRFFLAWEIRSCREFHSWDFRSRQSHSKTSAGAQPLQTPPAPLVLFLSAPWSHLHAFALGIPPPCKAPRQGDISNTVSCSIYSAYGGATPLKPHCQAGVPRSIFLRREAEQGRRTPFLDFWLQ